MPVSKLNPRIKRCLSTLQILDSAPLTEDTVKAAYRTLAMRYHPDKNPGNTDIGAKFREATDAYHEMKRLFESSGQETIQLETEPNIKSRDLLKKGFSSAVERLLREKDEADKGRKDASIYEMPREYVQRPFSDTVRLHMQKIERIFLLEQPALDKNQSVDEIVISIFGVEPESPVVAQARKVFDESQKSKKDFVDALSLAYWITEMFGGASPQKALERTAKFLECGDKAQMKMAAGCALASLDADLHVMMEPKKEGKRYSMAFDELYGLIFRSIKTDGEMDQYGLLMKEAQKCALRSQRPLLFSGKNHVYAAKILTKACRNRSISEARLFLDKAVSLCEKLFYDPFADNSLDMLDEKMAAMEAERLNLGRTRGFTEQEFFDLVNLVEAIRNDGSLSFKMRLLTFSKFINSLSETIPKDKMLYANTFVDSVSEAANGYVDGNTAHIVNEWSRAFKSHFGSFMQNPESFWRAMNAIGCLRKNIGKKNRGFRKPFYVTVEAAAYCGSRIVGKSPETRKIEELQRLCDNYRNSEYFVTQTKKGRQTIPAESLTPKEKRIYMGLQDIQRGSSRKIKTEQMKEILDVFYDE